MQQFKQNDDVDILMDDIVALEPQMEIVKLHASILPESNKMALRGELVVTHNQFKDELNEIQRNYNTGGLVGAIEFLKHNLSSDSIQ